MKPDTITINIPVTNLERAVSFYTSVIDLAGLETDPAPFGPKPRFGIGGIFEPALNESRRLGDDFVGTEHVVLAAFELEESLIGKVLRSFGLTKAEVERRIIEMRGEGEQATPE